MSGLNLAPASQAIVICVEMLNEIDGPRPRVTLPRLPPVSRFTCETAYAALTV